MAIAGEMKDISLPGIIQIICLERRMAQLALSRRGEEGLIFFENGDIVHAKLGLLLGEEALFQLLTWSEGSFRLTDKVQSLSRTISVNWNHLLMEGMRRIDEQRQYSELRPSHEHKPALSGADIERDTQISNELMMLMARFEQYIPKFEDKKVHKSPMLAIDLLCQLINQLIEVSEKIGREDYDQFSLKNVLIKLNDKFPPARILYLEKNRLSIQTAINLYQSWKNDPSDRGFMFRRISHAMLEILEHYFSYLIGCLQLPNLHDETEEIAAVLIGEFKRVFDQIKF